MLDWRGGVEAWRRGGVEARRRGAIDLLLDARVGRDMAYHELDGATIFQAIREDKKDDAAEAEQTCEGVNRPAMMFVPIKTDKQQAVSSAHRVCQYYLRARTPWASQICGMLNRPWKFRQPSWRVRQLLSHGARNNTVLLHQLT